MKSTEDTDDGYDECQTSDESSDIESNNVVSFLLVAEAKELPVRYDKTQTSTEVERDLVHDANIAYEFFRDDITH